MKQIFIQREDLILTQILNHTYSDLFSALKNRKPDAKELIEDDELCQLHDLLALLRLGLIQVSWGEDEHGRFMMLELKEE